jgi:RNA polymerase sigma-70 factor (ECF subfamily)
MDDEGDRGAPTLRVVPGGGRPGADSGRAGEEALLAAFLLGDDAAFGELVRRHEPLVIAIVRRYARTPEDARDLAQRTFLRAFEAARRAFRRGPRSAVPFRRWLVRVAVNLAKNHLRDEGRAPRASLESLDAAAAEAPAAADDLLHRERAARMRREVLRLPRRQREVLTLRIDAELPFAEIAQALGVTENAAKVSFHHATRTLREVLSREDRP